MINSIVPSPKKIALIFGQYGLQTQPYITNWAERMLLSANFDFCKFSFLPTSTKGIPTLENPSFLKKVNRLISSCFLYPNITAEWVNAKQDIPLQARISRFGRYSPLFCFQPAIVQIVNSYLYPSISPWLHNSGYKSIVSFRGYDISIRPLADVQWKETLRLLFEKVDILHFVSKHLQAEAIKLGAPEEKCRVIYPSINISEFIVIPQTPKNKQKTRIVSIGRLVWQKGLPLALLAIKKLVDRGVLLEYSIIGDGIEKEKLSYMIHMLGLGECVFLKGEQSQEIVKQALSEADIVFHPSESEALGVAVVEAAAMGKAIMASSAGGLPEIIEDNVTGRLFPVYDVDKMAEILNSLVMDGSLRYKLGMAAQKMARERFAVQRECDEWEHLYSSLV